MKRFKRSTQKNKGFSLVEVLVAMTVIALISIPLIRTFVISANYTRDARRLQNATDIAQNVDGGWVQRRQVPQLQCRLP